MLYELPLEPFEELIGEGLWVDHEFTFQGKTMKLKSIGQSTTNPTGCAVIPVEIEDVFVLN